MSNLSPDQLDASNEKSIEGGEGAHRRFSRIPPVWFLLSASILAAIFFVVAIGWATRVPWLGVQLASDPKGVRVVSVVSGGPGDGALVPGDLLVSICLSGAVKHSPDGRAGHRALECVDGEISLAGDSLIDGPNVYPTYAQYNRFFAGQKQLFATISEGWVVFKRSDGTLLAISPLAVRPWRDLSSVFWIISSVSMLVLLVGVGIWAFRPDQTPTRLIALNSAGYMVSGFCIATYATREWLLDAGLFERLVHVGHLGNMIYGYSAMALFWYYPRPLGRFPMAWAFMLSMTLIWINEVVEFVEWPLHSFTLQYFLPFTLGIAFAVHQWSRTRLHPDERAAMLWVVWSGLISIGIVMALYFLPQLFDARRVIPFWAGQLLVLGLYVGMVLGVVRFRLFDLDRWWFAIWAWFFGGLLVVLADLALIYNANLNPIGALPLSLLLVGWAYFPLRQWAWGRFLRSPSQRLETHLPLLLETFFAAPGQSRPHEQWEALLGKIFDPLDIRTVPGFIVETRLEEEGLVLAVPDIELKQRVLLSGRSRGTRLFNREDIQFASFILTLARKSAALRDAQERGATLERERIARDLHDDVAPQLLTLAHTAESPQNVERARAALQTLRESIYALSDPRETLLETVLAEWRVEVAERTEAAGVSLFWQQPEAIPGWLLSWRQRLNLGRVLREALSNALSHAGPTIIDITVEVTDERMAIRLAHDGTVTHPETWRAGKGLSNMRRRMSELGGRIDWSLTRPGSNLAVCWEAPNSQA